MDKEDTVHIHNGIPFGHKKRIKCSHLQQYGRTWRALSEMNQIEKDKYCMTALVRGI